MIDQATKNKIASCKALQGKTVADIVGTERFEKNLSAYITEQREARKAAIASYNAMKKAGGAFGLKLPAHPIDETMKWTVEQFAVEYLSVLARASKRPAGVRRYVEQLAQQAYNVTVAQIVCEEFPELTTVFFPAHNGQN